VLGDGLPKSLHQQQKSIVGEKQVLMVISGSHFRLG